MARYVASDRHIQQRRILEDKLDAARTVVAEDKSLRQYANWETRTHDKIKKNQLVRKIDYVQARNDETLEKRRYRLAQLLAAEQEQYERELEGLAETQEQRRDRIANKALELRAEREQLRKDLASEKKDTLFRQNCPELIEATSKARLLQVASDREKQLDWMKDKEQAEKAEQAYHDAMWEEERMKKERRGQEDYARQKDMQKQLQETLAVQKKVQQEKKAHEAEIERKEGEEFRERLRKGAEEDAERERRRRERQHELGRQNKMYNIELEEMKSQEMNAELEQDKKFLTDLLNRVKEDEDAERLAKKVAREAAVEHMKAVERQMMNAAGAETELDRLWQIESNKEWDKRERRWRADQEKRDKLLKETFEGRAQQVAANRALKESRKIDGEAERNKVIEEIQALQEKERQEAMARYNVAKNYQKCLNEQMDVKKVCCRVPPFPSMLVQIKHKGE
eukprot:TRINITY_DN12014_c0_g1_i1.p1 TRINITY_DN12014_c0_g1~~TRINITY_DN12014_c0_g1_i1.p1  ORF type:complete len:465 (+),score=213.71 TRINITY_DN12014_c0_g1_i1:36-1397(+)